MATVDSWIEVLTPRLGTPVMTTGDEVRFNCIFKDCGDKPDTKRHMYVNPVKGKFFCQRCRRGGSLDFLARNLGLESPEKSITMWESVIHGFLFGTESSEVTEKVIEPLDTYPVIPGTEAYRYLKSRGISDKRIEYYDIKFGTRSLFGIEGADRANYIGRGRVAFMDYDKSGELVYWVARTYSGHTAKYKNAKAPREYQVFNLGRMQRDWIKERVVICEGPISAIIAGKDAVATYGKHVTGSQISKLISFDAGEYIIALDGDATAEAASLATRLYRRGCKAKMIKFSREEDPASVGSLEFRRRVNGAKVWSSDSAMEVL